MCGGWLQMLVHPKNVIHDHLDLRFTDREIHTDTLDMCYCKMCQLV